MASKGINKVILVGNLGNDPESRATSSGNTVVNFSVATSEAWKDQQGQIQERTEWHRVTVWGKLAEICGKYLRKGSKVYIEGSIRTSSYEKNGEKRYSTDIVASEMQMLDRRDHDATPTTARTPSGPPMPPVPNSIPMPPAANGIPMPPAANGMPSVDFDDDIPF